nr:MAG TPA: type I neck protein [Caudoviricetes sp.]
MAAVLSASPMKACGKYEQPTRPPDGPGAGGWITAKYAPNKTKLGTSEQAMAKYVPNKSALKALLKDPMTQGIVVDHAEQVAAAAGDGFVSSYKMGKTRHRCIIYADTWSAKRREARDNILTRALG